MKDWGEIFMGTLYINSFTSSNASSQVIKDKILIFAPYTTHYLPQQKDS